MFALSRVCRSISGRFTRQELSSFAAASRWNENGAQLYNAIYPWRTLNEFVDVLQSNIIYEDNNIVAISKPYGVGTFTPYSRPNNALENEPSLFGDPRFCVNDAIPLLAKLHGCKTLQVSRSADRLWSGIMVLSKSDSAHKVVVRSKFYSRRYDPYYMCFHAITTGKPILPEPDLFETVGIKLMVIDPNTKETEAVIDPKYAQYKIKKFRFVKVRTHLRVLEYNRLLDTALVELECNSLNWNFPRVYLTEKTAAILGDARFGHRIKALLGQRIKVHHAHSYRNSPEDTLTSEIRKALRVKDNRSIPLMLHFRSFNLKSFLGRGKDLRIEAPNYPDHFKMTLKRLGLA